MTLGRKLLILGVYSMISLPLFSQAMYLEINLNEAQSDNPFALAKPPLETFRVIEKAANDDKVRGIILNIGYFPGGRDHLWELRNALEQFKRSGKKIVAFISSADLDIYNLASVADKIVMDELGTLSMLGFAVNKNYVKQTLEKIGVGVRELRYFEYKSASETFTRDSMSDADRRQYNDYLDDVFNFTRSAIMSSRNFTEEKFNTILDEFLFSAKSARDSGLVDGAGRREAVLEAVEQIEGAAVRQFALYGDSASSVTNSSFVYSAPKAGGLFRRPPVIAVIYANGHTDMHSGISALSLSETIRAQADKRRVKAIVIRINSPGGSAEAADYINEAIRYAKEKKPVVVSMGAVAGSGGYWASMNASHIAATPYTITGSIGVIGSWFFDNGLAAKLGFKTDTLQRGAHADLLTGVILPQRDLTADEEAQYKNYIVDLYNIFTAKAAAGRNMEIEQIEASAQGRIFSGTRALEAGLIDSIGGLSDALRTARSLAGIPENKNIKYDEFPKPKFFERMLGNFSFAKIFTKNGGGKNNALEFFADLFLPDGYAQFSSDIHYRLKMNGKVMPILPLE